MDVIVPMVGVWTMRMPVQHRRVAVGMDVRLACGRVVVMAVLGQPGDRHGRKTLDIDRPRRA